MEELRRAKRMRPRREATPEEARSGRKQVRTASIRMHAERAEAGVLRTYVRMAHRAAGERSSTKRRSICRPRGRSASKILEEAHTYAPRAGAQSAQARLRAVRSCAAARTGRSSALSRPARRSAKSLARALESARALGRTKVSLAHLSGGHFATRRRFAVTGAPYVGARCRAASSRALKQGGPPTTRFCLLDDE